MKDKGRAEKAIRRLQEFRDDLKEENADMLTAMMPTEYFVEERRPKRKGYTYAASSLGVTTGTTANAT